jgi:ubiquinone/menaquinone biosynthesis C-methylase UbiE
VPFHDAEDVQLFHRWSRTYESSLGQAFFFDPVHRASISLVAGLIDGSPPAFVLDVGCGTGRLLRKAARKWPAARLVGVDPAAGMLEIARRLTPAAELLQGSGEAIPLSDSTVDIAFSTISFHHWQDQAAGLREVVRVLRPRGLFCLSDGALPACAAGLIRHSRVHTRGEIEALFEEAGLPVRVQKRIVAGGVLATIGEKA